MELVKELVNSTKPHYRGNGKMWDNPPPHPTPKIQKNTQPATEGHQAGGPIEEEEVKSQQLVLQGCRIRGDAIGTCHYKYPATTKLSAIIFIKQLNIGICF